MLVLQQNIPQLRPLLCGRVLPDPLQFPVVAVPLVEFDVPSAERFLSATLASKSNRIFEPADISLAVRSIERTPLALALAAQLFVEYGIDAVRSPSLFGFVLYTKDAAFLYNQESSITSRLGHSGLSQSRGSSCGACRRGSSRTCSPKFASSTSRTRTRPARCSRVSRARCRSSSANPVGSCAIDRTWASDAAALEREVGRTMVQAIDQAAVRFHSQSDEPASRAEDSTTCCD